MYPQRKKVIIKIMLVLFSLHQASISLGNPIKALKDAKKQLEAGKKQIADGKESLKNGWGKINDQVVKPMHEASTNLAPLVTNHNWERGCVPQVLDRVGKADQMSIPDAKDLLKDVFGVCVAELSAISLALNSVPVLGQILFVAVSVALVAVVTLYDIPDIVGQLGDTLGSIKNTVDTVSGTVQAANEKMNPATDPVGVYAKFDTAENKLQKAIDKIDSIVRKFEEALSDI
jgi:hypothetical protein